MSSMIISDQTYPILELPGRPPALLDQDVAIIYEVEIRVLNQARMDNDKFPNEFWFKLSAQEVVKSIDLLTNNQYLPKAYTWEGCNMLATLLKSDVTVKRSIEIIWGFSFAEKALDKHPLDKHPLDKHPIC